VKLFDSFFANYNNYSGIPGKTVAAAAAVAGATKMYEDLNIDPATFEGVALYRGRGCDRCKNTGYSGRMAIIEAMTVTDEIRKLIISRANTRELSKVAIGQGMRTLRMVALERAREGVSTLDQVLVLTSAH
jgi:type II secretory ATPase GspE/PulE/Tfp pilus assembly ATPase PilB-like protein